jgi:hypothetical protein
VGAFFRGARYIHISRVWFHITTSPMLRSRDILVKGRKQTHISSLNSAAKSASLK